jgi:hypothetical protein
LILRVEIDGEVRSADLYAAYDDGTLRRGEIIFEKLKQ